VLTPDEREELDALRAEVQSLRDRVEIDRLRADLAETKTRVAQMAVAVMQAVGAIMSLHGRMMNAPPPPGGQWDPSDSVRNALRNAEAVADAILGPAEDAK
jgi:hypothetical protein